VLLETNIDTLQLLLGHPTEEVAKAEGSEPVGKPRKKYTRKLGIAAF
jgi:hypothetical protein